MERNAFKYPQLLDQLRDEVLNVAARSRGWNDLASIESLRQNFKIGPLYEANGLVLIRTNDKLVGLVGTLNNWHLYNKSIVHLCSLGMLPEVQNRGFVQTLFSLLWMGNWKDKILRANYYRQQVYITAITHSPYILGLLRRFLDIYPSPHRAAPETEMSEDAHTVVWRFLSHIPFYTERVIMSKERKLLLQTGTP